MNDPKHLRRLRLYTGILAGLLSGTGLVLVAHASVLDLALAGALHGLGVFISWIGAHRGTSRVLTDVERRLVLATAVVIPGFGPALAPSFPSPTGPVPADAMNGPEVAPPPDTAAAEREQERRIRYMDADHAEPFVAVLRHGTADRRAIAIAQLAEMGGARQLAIVRDCLDDPAPEIRLVAAGELERIELGLLDRVAEAHAAWSAEPEKPIVILALAEAHEEIASAGVLDPASTTWHEREARRLRATVPAGAMPRSDEATIGTANTSKLLGAEALLAEAQAAFRARDFVEARRIAGSLRAAEHPLPPWLAAIAGDTTDDLATSAQPREEVA